MYRHKQKRVRIGGGKRISVDEGIADIIKGLNKNACSTIMSCQDSLGKIWIEFSLLGARNLQIICRTHPDINSDEFLWLLNLEWQYREMHSADWVALTIPLKEERRFRKLLKTVQIL